MKNSQHLGPIETQADEATDLHLVLGDFSLAKLPHERGVQTSHAIKQPLPILPRGIDVQRVFVHGIDQVDAV